MVIAHKVPNGRDADQPALEMLDGILSSGKSSRLYHALVDARPRARAPHPSTDLRRDLSLHTLYATLAPGASHEKVEQALLAEVEKIKTDGVTAQEIARVKQQVLAGEAYKRDGTAAVASELNEWIAIGDWTLYVTFPQKVEQVTRGRRAARRARVSGRASEHDRLVRAQRQAEKTPMTARRAFAGCILAACALAAAALMSVASAAASATRRDRCACRHGRAGTSRQTAGIDLVTYPHARARRGRGAGRAARGRCDGRQPATSRCPTLTGMMLDRGTTTLDKFAIAERLEERRCEHLLRGRARRAWRFARSACARICRMVLSILAAELREPGASRRPSSPRPSSNSSARCANPCRTRARAPRRRSRARSSRPAIRTARIRVEDMLSAAESATLEEIKAFHAKYVGPKHLTLILAGDVDDAAVRREVAKDFAGWRGGQDYLRSAPPGAAAREVPPHDIEVPLKDKPSTTIVLGQATGMRYRDPDALPLRVGTAILGQGFTGRLMGTVRDREGLTYGIGAGGERRTASPTAHGASRQLRAGAPRPRRRLDAPGARAVVEGWRHRR